MSLSATPTSTNSKRSPFKSPIRGKSNRLTGWITILSFIIFLIVWVIILFFVIHTNSAMSESPIAEGPDTHEHVIKGVVDIDIENNIRNTNNNHGLLSLLSPSSSNSIRSIKELTNHLPIHLDERPINSPPTLEEVKGNLTSYLRALHSRLGALAGRRANPEDVWEAYLEVTKDKLITWDDKNKIENRYYQQRSDGSIYVSLGTYRDPYCPMTIKSLYSQASDPGKIYVGLLQQNCFEDHCRTGVLKGGRVEDTGKDVDCYEEFCHSIEGKRSNACNNGNIRLFNVNESESLGPYMARYMGAKFYQGENYYLQIDSHSEFVNNWDMKLIKMMNDAPARRPVISTYPPDSTHKWRDSIGFRMCDSGFATAQIEWQIIRLGTSLAFDHSFQSVPCYAPFVAAGFFFTTSQFLHEVPFDPLLPWIFMGEEISMSARLWTAGYDIFSPTINVLNHYYVRRHYPKFWESVNRYFKTPIHNELTSLVLKRVKSMLEYPESMPGMIQPKSLLYRLDDWSMGGSRPLSRYMKMVGIDVNHKETTPNMWCRRCTWPAIAQEYKLN